MDLELELTKTLGCVVLRGLQVDKIAQHSPQPFTSKPSLPYHVTLFTKAETQQSGTQSDVNKKQLEQLLRNPPSLEPLIDLGVGIHGSVAFNVIFWPQGNQLRRQAGLPRKQFHITLTSVDNHDIDKGINSVRHYKALTVEHVDRIIQNCSSLAKDLVNQDIALEMVQFIVSHHLQRMSEVSFDIAWRVLAKLSNTTESSALAFDYLDLHPQSIAALLRAAHCCELPQEAKQSMCLYAQAVHLLLPNGRETIVSRCVDAIVRCSQHTEFGLFFLDSEVTEVKNDRTHLITSQEAFCNPKLRKLIQTQAATSWVVEDTDSLLSTRLSLASNQDIFTLLDGDMYRLPRFFRWLTPFRLAVMSTPRCAKDIKALASHNISLVVTLTEEGPLPVEWFAGTSCKNVFMPVRNYQAPSIEQVNGFIKLVDDLPPEEAALVHCGGGKGRAGTFAACYLMARGFQTDKSSDEEPIRMFPGDAMRLLRHLRPGSIETAEQESFIRDYAQYLVSGHKKITVEEMPRELSEPQVPLELSEKLPRSPSMIVCCGVPGSGKSTFASQLAKHLNYTVICQDDLGSRTACLKALTNAIESGQKVIVDRCNPYMEDRGQWLAHAFHPEDALCVWFDVDPDICVKRADARANHPTIKPGRAKRIVHSFQKTFVRPSDKEKFACIARVASNAAASDLLQKMGMPNSGALQSQHDHEEVVGAVVDRMTKDSPDSQASHQSTSRNALPERPFIYKFPRTRHLFNVGSATRDDLILTASDAQAFLNTSDPAVSLVIEEKVDGANLGISIDPSGTGFKVQNRSHYINSKSHAQFKKLNKWLKDHYEDLNSILGAKSAPGKWILYGEWLFAKHSIHYTGLPDLFLAFDLFDTESGTFLSRDALSERLQGTSIHQVNHLDLPDTLSEQTLLGIVRSHQSLYCAGIVEGVYLRRQRDGKTIDRAKIVRSDFIAGDEHWNRKGITLNTILYDQE